MFIPLRKFIVAALGPILPGMLIKKWSKKVMLICKIYHCG